MQSTDETPSKKSLVAICVATGLAITGGAVYLAARLTAWGPPRPTDRSVAPQDVAGAWAFASAIPGTPRIRLVFRPDGTFRETAKDAHGRLLLDVEGKWQLRGANLLLDNAIVGDVEGNLCAGPADWFLGRSIRGGRQLSIYGEVLDDSDVYQELMPE